MPDRKKTEAYALAHNHGYLEAVLSVSNSERQYKEALNSTKWNLNLDLKDTETVGGSKSQYGNYSGSQSDRSVGLDFSTSLI